MKKSVAFVSVLLANFLLTLILDLARWKGAALPCGSLLGCGQFIQLSPVVLGLHLTRWGVVYSAGGILLCAMGLYSVIPERRFGPIMTVWCLVGMLVSIGTNIFGFIERDAVCMYCLSVLTLCTLGFLLAPGKNVEEFLKVKGVLGSVLPVFGVVATIMFVLLKIDLLNLKIGQLVKGIPADDLIVGERIRVGPRQSEETIVCFYSPECNVCKQTLSVAGKYLIAHPDTQLVFRCVASKGIPSSGLACAAIEQVAIDEGAEAAIESVVHSNPSMTKISAAAQDAAQTNSNMAHLLDIDRFPTFVKVKGGVGAIVTPPFGG